VIAVSSTIQRALMDQLHSWLEDQLTEAKIEPNSGLGKEISYLLNHWQALTLFLRQIGVSLTFCHSSLCIENRDSCPF
jgi:hypothetical protein